LFRKNARNDTRGKGMLKERRPRFFLSRCGIFRIQPEGKLGFLRTGILWQRKSTGTSRQKGLNTTGFFVAVKKKIIKEGGISFPVNSKPPDVVQTHPLAIRAKDILLNNSQAIVLQAMTVFPLENNNPGDGRQACYLS
jgi:hypothetical protein